MEVMPAIDLRHGQVVRLTQGDYAKQTTFSDDPIAVAAGFVEAGAVRIHVVDLDGALDGTPTQADLCARVAKAVPVPIEVGGGFRNADHVTAALSAGMDRVVLGTAAVENPTMVGLLIEQHGAERIVVGLDARDGIVAVSGWTQSTGVAATELMAQMHALGVRRFVYTDIARDGMLSSPNFEAVAEMVAHAEQLGGAAIIASGGIADAEHLRRLAGAGVEGAIVGSAIYRGTVDLAAIVAELGAS